MNRFLILSFLFSLSLLSMNAADIQMDYFPAKTDEVSEEDYRRAKYFLSNTYQSIREHDNEKVYADYWNVAVAYSLMGMKKADILSLLVQSKEMNQESFCSIVQWSLEEKELAESRFYLAIGQDYADLISDCEPETKNPSLESRMAEKEGLDLTGLNEALIDQLLVLMEKDQRHRALGQDYQDNWAEQTALDKEVQAALTEIFETYGYPGKSLVGKTFDDYACLMLEHGGEIAYQERYFPLVIAALNKGEVSPAVVRMLIDRIHWKKTEKQIFGSHVGVPFDSDAVIEKVKEKYGL